MDNVKYILLYLYMLPVPLCYISTGTLANHTLNKSATILLFITHIGSCEEPSITGN